MADKTPHRRSYERKEVSKRQERRLGVDAAAPSGGDELEDRIEGSRAPEERTARSRVSEGRGRRGNGSSASRSSQGGPARARTSFLSLKDDSADSGASSIERTAEVQADESAIASERSCRGGERSASEGSRRVSDERRRSPEQRSREGRASEDKSQVKRKRSTDRSSTRRQPDQVVRRSFSQRSNPGSSLVLSGGGLGGGLSTRGSRNSYAPRNKNVFSQGGGLASLLPKAVLALVALAFVGIVIPNAFSLVKGFFVDKSDEGGSSGSNAVEFVVPEPYELNYDPSTASMASMPAATEGVTGFTLATEDNGYVPSMSAEQQAAVQSVLDQYAPNNRTVGFAFIDLRTSSGYAYNVDADVYGASSFKAHVAVFACQNQAENGVVKQSAFRQSAETAVVWSDNDAYYRLRSASGAKGDALRTWLSGMGLDPAIADDTFPTYSAREAATLWMNTYLYLSSGDPSLTGWLAGLLSTTNVSMVCDAGIIAEGDETYLMAIMTSAPDSTGNRQLVSDLANALWAARDTLQPPGLVKV